MVVEESEKVADKIRGSELLRNYGGLLSEKQARILGMYYDEDLGFSEIAEELGITRQAVYDATRQGKSTLEKYERHLGLLDRQLSSVDGSARQSAGERTDAVNQEECRRLFATVERMAAEDIIYDTRRLRRRLRQLKQSLWP